MKGLISKKVVSRICAGVLSSAITVSSLGAYVYAEENCENYEAVEVLDEEVPEDADNEVIIQDEEINDVVLESATSGDFQYTVVSGGCRIDNYIGSQGYISIPETLGGYSVVSIADDFLYNKSVSSIVTSVTIPYTVTSIGSRAFKNCTNLQNVTFGTYKGRVNGFWSDEYYATNLTSIGEEAFAGDTKLTSIDMSAYGPKTIGAKCFDGCTGITNIRLASSVSTIGEDAFKDLNNLESFYFIGNINQWININFGSDTKGTHPNAYAKQVYIGEYHDDGWGYGSTTFPDITSITLSSDMRVISGYLFANFTKLKSIDLTNVNSINEGAFYNCVALEEVTVGDRLSILGENAFYGCASLKTISIGVGLSKISSKAFYGCKVINNISIDKNVTVIAADAFDGCDALKRVSVYYQSVADEYFSNREGCTVTYLGNTSTYENQTDNYLYGYSALYDGNIGMRFYFKVSNPSSTDYVNFIIPTEDGEIEEKKYFSSAEKEGDYYKFTIYFAPKFAARRIGAKIEASNVSNPKTYWISFYDYAILLEKFNYTYNVNDIYLNIIKRMVSYCDAVQNYLNFDAGTVDAEKYGATLNEVYSSNSPSINDPDYLGMTMSMDDTITIKLYFKGKRDIGIYTDVAAFNSNWESNYVNGLTIITVSGFKYGYRKSNPNTLSLTRKLYLTYDGVTSNDVFTGLSYAYLAYSSDREDLIYLGRAACTLDTYLMNYKSDFLVRKVN